MCPLPIFRLDFGNDGVALLDDMCDPPSKSRFFVYAIENRKVSDLDREGLLGVLQGYPSFGAVFPSD